MAVEFAASFVAELAGPTVLFVDLGGNLGRPAADALSLCGDTAFPEV
jgi:hypothetical protein